MFNNNRHTRKIIIEFKKLQATIIDETNNTNLKKRLLINGPKQYMSFYSERKNYTYIFQNCLQLLKMHLNFLCLNKIIGNLKKI